MKHPKFPRAQKLNPIKASPAPAAEIAKVEKIDFTPSPEAVARKAFFAYENEGSLPGRDVQHWLAAEAELTAERKLTRTHGFHTQT